MKICCRLWIDNEGKAFGNGPLQILLAIKKYGSLREAAKKLGISYNKAWITMQMVEQRMGFKVLYTTVGGQTGGGSLLTSEAEEFVAKYEAFVKEANHAVTELFNKHFTP